MSPFSRGAERRPDPFSSTPSRRAVTLGLALLAASAAAPVIAAERLRVGLLAFGTASWVIETLEAQGLDAANGLDVVPVELASSDAARVAFQSGAVDAVVSDLVFAGRRAAEGRPTVFAPFSAAEGAVMVPAASPIASLADLKGRRIGVAGGALDKSWLLLRAEVARRHGIDLAREAEPIFGAPPLLARQLERGDLDAALLYWTWSSRLETKGFRPLSRVGDLARGFGTAGDVALIGWIFRGEDVAADPSRFRRFLAAVAAAEDRMATDPGVWERIRPSMRAETEAVFAALRRDFLAGRPKRPIAEEEADARILWSALARIGGAELVGPARDLPKDLYRIGPDGGS